MGYKIPFVNYPKQYHNIESEIDAAIKEVLLNGDFILRGQLGQFESNMASYLGTVALFTAARFNGFTSEQLLAAILPAFLVSVPIGRAGLWLTTRMRHHNNRLCEHFIGRIDRGEFPSVTAWHLLGIVRSYMRGAIMALVLVPVGAVVCGAIVLLPGSTVHIMSHAVPMIFGTVCAAAAYVYWTRHERKPLALGALGGILWVIAYSAIV